MSNQSHICAVRRRCGRWGPPEMGDTQGIRRWMFQGISVGRQLPAVKGGMLILGLGGLVVNDAIRTIVELNNGAEAPIDIAMRFSAWDRDGADFTTFSRSSPRQAAGQIPY